MISPDVPEVQRYKSTSAITNFMDWRITTLQTRSTAHTCSQLNKKSRWDDVHFYSGDIVGRMLWYELTCNVNPASSVQLMNDLPSCMSFGLVMIEILSTNVFSG